jgi:hypothetical protein
MKTELAIRRTILAMALAALGASGTALAGSYNAPEALQIGPGGAATVTGSISSPSDVDFYSFEAKVREDPSDPTKQTKVSIDIDGTTFPENVIVFVLDPTHMRRYTADNAPYDPVNDPQSMRLPLPLPAMTLDPRLDFLIDKDGTWTIAVASNGVMVSNGGTVTVGPAAHAIAKYSLNVSGLTPTMQEIAIDVRPGNNELSVLNPKAKGVIPVALLSEAGFDPFEVDLASLRFGRTGEESSLQRCAKDGVDLNDDGKPDRVCHFDNEKTGFTKTCTTAKVKGTKRGKPFQGTADLKVVPQKHDD